MEFSSAVYGDKIVVIEIKGEIDAYNAKTLDKTLTDFFNQGYNRFVIDVSKVTLVNSTGLRAFLFAHREASNLGGEVRLSGPNSQIKRIFEISGLYDLLEISETLQDAMNGW